MKRISIYLLSLMVSGAFFAACDDDESNGKLTFDKNSVEMIIGDEAVVKVSGGAAPYEATPVDETVAEATVEGSDITIKGLKEGNTTVKVTDKDGLEATIAVAVKEDPYAEEKEDATVRIEWDTHKKVEGTDAGTFTLTRDAETKIVTYSWTNEEENESLVLTFTDAEDKIGGNGGEEETASVKAENSEPVGKLTVTVGEEDPVDYDVTAWSLLQAQPADDEEGTPDTYWIAFTAGDKLGICVAPLTVVTE